MGVIKYGYFERLFKGDFIMLSTISIACLLLCFHCHCLESTVLSSSVFSGPFLCFIVC